MLDKVRSGRRSLAISSKPFSCRTQLGLTHIRHAASVAFHIVPEGKIKFWGLSEEENPFPARDGSKIKDTETFCRGWGEPSYLAPEVRTFEKYMSQLSLCQIIFRNYITSITKKGHILDYDLARS